jgi:hypothetical protein
MTNLRIKEDLNISRTDFETVQDLYDFFIDNQMFVEI